MSKIRVLPDSLANKIAAGEVVERPASVVKELLENALDAAAHKINIEVEAGGKRLIRIIDDGEGMTRDDAILAFERHATSKLRTAEDLENISTLGFRGEALPTIAAVSKLVLRTKTADEVEGTEVEFNGGKLVNVRDIAWPGGTEIEVKDLFFNVPARRKFLKSDATESFHITNLAQHYALANPQLAFLLINNGRDSIRVASVESLKDRAYQILGGGMLKKLLEVKHEANGLKIVGYVSNPQEQRSSRDAQYLFVNRRFVKDPLISRALTEAYRSMMPSGTYPAAVLFIELPPDEVDVNVHPAKTEVRFLHEAALFSFVRDAIAQSLKATQTITRLPDTYGQVRSAEERLKTDAPRWRDLPTWSQRTFSPVEALPTSAKSQPPATTTRPPLGSSQPATDNEVLNEGSGELSSGGRRHEGMRLNEGGASSEELRSNEGATLPAELPAELQVKEGTQVSAESSLREGSQWPAELQLNDGTTSPDVESSPGKEYQTESSQAAGSDDQYAMRESAYGDNLSAVTPSGQQENPRNVNQYPDSTNQSAIGNRSVTAPVHSEDLYSQINRAEVDSSTGRAAFQTLRNPGDDETATGEGHDQAMGGLPTNATAEASHEESATAYWHGIKPMGQIRDSYIVATDDEGLLLFDQHVVHERILFEQIRDGKMSRATQIQPLLIPETLDLTPAEVEAFHVVKDELEHLGIETMELSGRTIAIKTAPAGITSKDVVAIVQQLLSAVERERRTFTIETIRDEIAASLACKAAIKVNMPLTDEKMQWLINELMKTQNPMTCPHGRPIIMRFDLRDIERGFKRPV